MHFLGAVPRAGLHEFKGQVTSCLGSWDAGGDSDSAAGTVPEHPYDVVARILMPGWQSVCRLKIFGNHWPVIPSFRGSPLGCGRSGNSALIPVHAGMRVERHDMATDPEQIIWSLSLASRQAGRLRGRVVGTGGPCCHGLPTSYPAAAAIIFPVIAASGFWASGVAVLAVLAVGDGHLALNQIRTIPAADVNACWASSAARAPNPRELHDGQPAGG